MKKNLKIMSSNELKQFWNQFSNVYSSTQEHNTFPFYPILSNIVKITDKLKSQNQLNILELAAGSGEGLHYLTNKLKSFDLHNKKINLTGTDLSHIMLSSAYNKLKALSDVSVSMDGHCEPSNNPISINLKEADNEQLPFKDNSFDCIISNFSLNLVSNPHKMLRESARVLNKGGLSAFSVWGRPKDSLVFTIYSSILKKMGIFEQTEERSLFHLGNDDEALKKLVLSNGFDRVNISHSFIPFNISEIHDYDFIFNSPNYQEMFKKIGEGKVVEFKKEFHRKINDIISKGEMMGLDTAIILCKKI
jgi:ubiquinone/menaquinone biosynthesis C-methylase UbiE